MKIIRLLKFSFATLLLVSALTGCDAVDSLRDGLKHAQAVSTKLENSLGIKPFVAFKWNNGQLTQVSVTFEGVPADFSLMKIAEISRSAIRQEFHQNPERILVSFAISP